MHFTFFDSLTIDIAHLRNVEAVDRNFPTRKFPPLCSPPEVSPPYEICRWREPVPNRVPDPNASYKPEQRRGESVPPGVKNPRGEKTGGNTGMETFGGERP